MKNTIMRKLSGTTMWLMVRMRWFESICIRCVRAKPNWPVLWYIRHEYAGILGATATPDRWVRIATGGHLYLDAGNLYSRVFVAGTAYEPSTTTFVMEHLKNGDTFVDIGAYQGYFSIMAGDLVGARGNAVAFEPVPDAVNHLSKSISRNGYEDRVRVVNAALSDGSETERDFFLSGKVGNAGLSSFDAESAGYKDEASRSSASTITVRCCSLDAWLAENPLGPIRMVKIDAEGWDLTVLEGMKEVLTSSPPDYIIVETQADSDVAAFLARYGYIANDIPESLNVAFQYQGEASRED